MTWTLRPHGVRTRRKKKPASEAVTLTPAPAAASEAVTSTPATAARIYLTPKSSSFGHFVAFEGSQDGTVVVPVRDLKIASPIRFVAGLGMLCEIPNSKSGVKPDRIERLPTDLSKPQKLVDLPIHEGEPPWYWSEVNKTSRRPACSNGSETGHSVKCRNRYKKYLEEDYKRIVPIEDESSVPVVPEGLEEGLDTEGKTESQQESGERVPESESEREKRKRKSIDEEWDRFHREHEEKETGERFPEFDDVPFHAPKEQEVDTEPTPTQEDPTNPYMRSERIRNLSRMIG